MLARPAIAGDLNAILVKELRQELRVRGFVWSFVGFHIVMIALTFTAFTTTDQPSDWSIVHGGLFWTVLAVPLFITMPLRAFTAFSKEANAKELELIFLTRTSSWQIVFYKWLALCLQGTLLLTAALPYAIVRYVVGSLDILDAFTSLGILLLIAMLLTAVVLVVSAQRVKHPRFSVFTIVVGLFIGLPLLQNVIAFVFLGALSGYGGLRLFAGAGMPIVLLIYAAFFLILFLAFSASQIAPPAENHAVMKRLLGISALVTGLFLHGLGLSQAWVIEVFTGLFLLLICICALCEEPVYVQSIYAPFVQGSAWKRCLGMWLYPGWPSGVVYTISICVLFFATMPTVRQLPIMPLGGVAIAAGLCQPLVLGNLFWPRHRKKAVDLYGRTSRDFGQYNLSGSRSSASRLHDANRDGLCRQSVSHHHICPSAGKKILPGLRAHRLGIGHNFFALGPALVAGMAAHARRGQPHLHGLKGTATACLITPISTPFTPACTPLPNTSACPFGAAPGRDAPGKYWDSAPGVRLNFRITGPMRRGTIHVKSTGGRMRARSIT